MGVVMANEGARSDFVIRLNVAVDNVVVAPILGAGDVDVLRRKEG